MSIIVLELCGSKRTVPPVCSYWCPCLSNWQSRRGYPRPQELGCCCCCGLSRVMQKAEEPTWDCSYSHAEALPRIAHALNKPRKMNWSKTRDSGRCRDFHKTPRQGKQEQLCPLCAAHRLPWLSSEPFSGELNLGYCMLWNSSCRTKVEFWLRHLPGLSGVLWDLYMNVSVLKSSRKLFCVNLL